MCAALRPLQACPLSGGKFRFPSRAIPCPKSLPLQARLGLLFLFLPFFCPFVLPPAWRGWLSLIPVRRCPGFVYNWLTQLQQGGEPVLPVLRPYPILKTARRATEGFSLSRSFSPGLYPTGKGQPVPESGLSRFPGFAHNCPTRLEQGGEPVLLVSFPYPVFKTAHRATQRQVLFHRFFFACLCSGRASKSRFRL